MKLVVDTNVLISALIKDSVTRKIITKSGWEFYYPEISLQEIENYKNLILEKSGMNNVEFEDLFNILMRYINLIMFRKFSEQLESAKRIIQHVDPDDVVFIALALSFENDGVWSDDKHFKMQEEIEIYTTEEVVREFGFGD